MHQLLGSSESTAVLVIPALSYDMSVVNLNPQAGRRITLCNLFNDHCSQNGKGKHCEETSMSWNSKSKTRVVHHSQRARVLDSLSPSLGPIPRKTRGPVSPQSEHYRLIMLCITWLLTWHFFIFCKPLRRKTAVPRTKNDNRILVYMSLLSWSVVK